MYAVLCGLAVPPGTPYPILAASRARSRPRVGSLCGVRRRRTGAHAIGLLEKCGTACLNATATRAHGMVARHQMHNPFLRAVLRRSSSAIWGWDSGREKASFSSRTAWRCTRCRETSSVRLATVGWGRGAADACELVSDTSLARMQELEPDSTHVSTWGTLGALSGEFQNPTAVSVEPVSPVRVPPF